MYDFWRGLAVRMGMSEHFPWETNEALLDYRLQKLGMDFESFASEFSYHAPPYEYRKYAKVGFATPSGLVELYSSVLDNLFP